MKKTPLKNWSTITTGETTAEAPRPLFGTVEKAIPKTVDDAVPKIMSQVKVNHFDISVGIFKPKKKYPPASKRIT